MIILEQIHVFNENVLTTYHFFLKTILKDGLIEDAFKQPDFEGDDVQAFICSKEHTCYLV